MGAFAGGDGMFGEEVSEALNDDSISKEGDATCMIGAVEVGMTNGVSDTSDFRAGKFEFEFEGAFVEDVGVLARCVPRLTPAEPRLFDNG